VSDSQRALSGSIVLGRYRIVRELARGGMGMVYLGRVEGAAGFAKPVVIKRVLSHMDDEEGVRAQFVREARLLSDLQHPGIVGVIDFGQERDSYLMVLEYVHGYNLGHWLKYARETRGNLEWDFATFAMARVLAALHYAHSRVAVDGRARPIIHRDISPANVLVDLQGNVRLLDFGIARSSEEPDEFKTQEGIVKGKLPYIAPEMYQGVEASVASDIYAAGVSLYQLLSGKNPFSAKDMSTIVTRVLTYDPPPLASMRDDVPPDLDSVLAQAMHKKPAERYGTAAEFASALTSLFERSETEILGDFRDAVIADFTGDLPDRLQLPALATLDAAWRESSSDPTHEESLLASSKPPSSDRTSVVRVPNDRLSEQTLRELTTDSGRVARAAVRREGSAGAPAAAPRPGISSRTIALSMLGAALIAGGVAAAVVVFGKPEPRENAPQRYLLVERPPTAAASPSVLAPEPPAPAASAAVQDPEQATVANTPPPVASPPTAGRSATDAERLTAAFAKKQGAVQGCFTKSAGQLEGSPQVSVHFKVSATGAIQGASIAPAQLSGTTLGQCVLAVAGSTQFPALGKEVAFSIPITARVVQR
jgi:serine/threonine protein kinase